MSSSMVPAGDADLLSDLKAPKFGLRAPAPPGSSTPRCWHCPPQRRPRQTRDERLLAARAALDRGNAFLRGTPLTFSRVTVAGVGS